jgi:hypothetical protein
MNYGNINKRVSVVHQIPVLEKLSPTIRKMNWFAEQGEGFQNVINSEGLIKCKEFMHAAKNFTTILNSQKSAVFIPIKGRFGNNVNQMNDFYKLHTDMETLHDLIKHEVSLGESDIDAICASRGVVWFTRACQFLLEAFDHNISNPEIELVSSFREAYPISLGKHHDGIVKKLFDLAMTFCPKRKVFYEELCNEDSLEKTMKDAEIYFTHMRVCKDRLVQYCRYRKWNVGFRDESEDIYENARKRKLESEQDIKSCKSKGA